jgi:hypothetical protein
MKMLSNIGKEKLFEILYTPFVESLVRESMSFEKCSNAKNETLQNECNG